MGRRSRTRRARQGAPGGADATPSALPALASLSDVPAFGELSMGEAQREAFDDDVRALAGEGVDSSEVVPACVVRLDRYFPAVVSERGLARAEFSFRFGVVSEPSAAVGDWVCLRVPEGHDMAVIEYVLPRESDIARWRGGARGTRQTLAANVDTVLVAQALGRRQVDVNRIARSAVIAADCGAASAVVLTKADRAGEDMLGRDVELVRLVLGRDVAVVATAAGVAGGEDGGLESVARAHGASWGVEGVRALVPAGEVAIVLGESGAGKSTLLNALLGRDVLETGAVRASDGAGRHTTVARRMVSLPRAGVVVDEPGLRSLPLVGHERGLAKVFPEIAQAASSCRFRDCTHTHEPGCAVREALAEGAFPRERLDVYLALAAEMRASADSLDPDVVI